MISFRLMFYSRSDLAVMSQPLDVAVSDECSLEEFTESQSHECNILKAVEKAFLIATYNTQSSD